MLLVFFHFHLVWFWFHGFHSLVFHLCASYTLVSISWCFGDFGDLTFLASWFLNHDCMISFESMLVDHESWFLKIEMVLSFRNLANLNWLNKFMNSLADQHESSNLWFPFSLEMIYFEWRWSFDSNFEWFNNLIKVESFITFWHLQRIFI